MEWIRHALGVARANGFAEVELVVGDVEFTAHLSAKPAAPKAMTAIADLPVADETVAIKSPCVGYFRSGKEDLRPGRRVESGEIVALVAALGHATDVESKVSGEIVEVLVQPDQPVEYGQPIARIKVK